MSWTHEGNRGTANSKTASSTFSITLNADVDAGQILLLWVVCDGNSAGEDNSAATFDVGAFAVTDDSDNIYAQLYAAGQTNADGVFGALFITRVQYALSSGDQITIRINESPVAKAASVHEFSIDRDTFARYEFYDFDIQWTAGSGDVPDIIVSPPLNQEYLWVHLLAVEGPNTDTYTWDADYTQITGDGTTGGADDSNVHIRGGFRVFTGTSDTVSVTSNTADRDLSQAFMVLTECDFKPGGFPTCDVLDNFNRADADPLSGQWIYSSAGGGLGAVGDGSIVNAHFRLDGNEVKLSEQTHDDHYGKYYWDDSIPCFDFEVYATMSQVPSDESHTQPIPQPPTNRGIRGVHVGVSGPDGAFSAGPATGFFRYSTRASYYVVDDLIWAHHPGQGIRTKSYIGAHTVGMRIGLQCDGGRFVHFWIDRNTGHGWELWYTLDYLTYKTIGSVDFGDPTRFFLTISGTESATAAADNFGGCYDCFGPQIYRRVSG